MRPVILIVDDCEQTATSLEIALMELRDVDVFTLTSAAEALRWLADDKRRIAAVVTDLHLPQIDGFELIDKIRSSPRYLALPIIVVTGDGDPNIGARILRQGATAYYPKPYSPADVRQALEGLIYAR